MDTPPAPTCRACGSARITPFYRANGIPTLDAVMLFSPDEAHSVPTGDLELGFCEDCGFIANLRFDETLVEYSDRYEATQRYSKVFSTFAEKLVREMIDRYDLHGKDLVEIGGGQGSFLIQLCELGDNRGVGIDPAYVEARSVASAARERVRFLTAFYSAEKHGGLPADFVFCRMTLEHIAEPYTFVRTIRESLGDRTDTVVYFEVPDAQRVWDECAFWDIYYEHTNYFTAGSLANLFRRCGFDVLDTRSVYGGQKLVLEARPASDTAATTAAYLPALRESVLAFTQRVDRVREFWKTLLTDTRAEGKTAIVWGGLSKGTSFLTTLNISDEVAYVVDINPHKNNTYVPGSGHRIVTPDYARNQPPDVVVVMNPIYVDEITQELAGMDMHPAIYAVGADDR